MSDAFLTAKGVNVSLGGRAALQDISLSLSSGHLVALVGPSMPVIASAQASLQDCGA